MPILKSAKKRVRTTARQTAENQLHRTRARTALKQVRSLLADDKAKQAAAAFATAQTYLDKAAKVRAFHPNTVARYKKRLAAAVKDGGHKGATPTRAKSVGTKSTAPKTAKTTKSPAKAPTKKPVQK